MRKMLGTLVLLVALMAPAQIVSARSHETTEMNYQVFERMTSAEMKMGEVMMKLIKARGKMTKAKMTKIMNALDSIDAQIQKLLEIGDE